MSNVWFTSDLHLGHETVAVERAEAYGAPAVAAHPHLAVRWHDQHLAWNWDAAVKPSDQVWVLGDLSVGGTEAVARALNWLHDRPGEKHLVPGNHDPIHPSNRDSHRWVSAFGQAFASVQPFARRKIAGHQVLLSHFPYVGDHTPADRFSQYRLRDEGLPILHGHTHSGEKVTRTADGTLQVHVGVDAWGYAPVSLDQVADIIEPPLCVERHGIRPGCVRVGDLARCDQTEYKDGRLFCTLPPGHGGWHPMARPGRDTPEWFLIPNIAISIQNVASSAGGAL